MASTEDLFQTPDAGDATETPAPARKRARRATKKASAPAPAASVEQAAAEIEVPAEGGAAADGEVLADAPAAALASKTAAPAKKAAKKTAKKAAPRRSAKKAPETAPAVDLLDDALADLVTEPVTDADPAVMVDALAEEESETPIGEDEVAPAVPSFGLLFQAPDVTKAPTRLSRRAAAKAGPPAAEAATPEPRESDTADRTDAAGEIAPDGTDEQDSEGTDGGRRRRRRGGKGRGRGRTSGDDANEAGDSSDRSAGPDDGDHETAGDADLDQEPSDQGDDGDGRDDADSESQSTRRRRRRRRGGAGGDEQDPPGTVTRVREARRDEPQSVKGSTRLEAKKQRRREGREAGRRRTVITEAEFLARRESVERIMVVRERDGKTQIGVLEDDVLVEHYVSRESNVSMAGNVYLGRVQNVLPSMEAAFVDIGKGRNAVLYAGEVNWDAAGLENNQPKRIENALKSGDAVLVQVTKDPIGHKGARLTSQISLPGRYLVYVPEGSMTGISRKLPDTERGRLKGILKEVVPDSAGVIVRTAAEGASEDELRADVERLTRTWEKIKAKADSKSKAKGGSPVLVHGEPDLTVRVIRDVFNEDFSKLVVAGDQAYAEVSEYLGDVAPDLAERLEKWTSEQDLFTHHRVDEQIAKAMDRKVWLPSGGSLVIDRTEAMTVVDVNTGKFVGSGGNLEETVTKNNIEAAEEIVRQLRLRDIGGIIVI
ncbi:MAG TPA: Rne/Rng family ribonuclease, partial [Pedococcus sp.]|nr:Rne/Rng family ribonuclease [Pedococcus sp.]